MTEYDVQQEVRRISLETGVDPRTARRALKHGIECLRTFRLQDVLRVPVAQARVRLGLETSAPPADKCA